MNHSSNTFSVSYKLRHDKLKHGKAPITLKITVNGRKAEMFVKRKIEPEKWHDRKKVIGSSPEVKAFNRYLDKFYHQAHEVYEKLLIDKQPISAARIKNLLLGKEIEEEVTLLYLTKYHNEHMASSLSHNTIKHYETTERYLRKFLKQKKNANDIFLQQITYKFIIDFESFLRNWKPTDYKRPMNNNGVMKHMTRLRKLMNLAIKMEWMEKYPFKNYRVKYQSVTRECLTESELKAIEERELSLPRLRIVRDIFIFCCYTGLSYIDAYNLKEENIVIGIDGEKWISFKRQKTKTAFQVPLLPKALDILYKYKDYPRLMEERALPLFQTRKRIVT